MGKTDGQLAHFNFPGKLFLLSYNTAMTYTQSSLNDPWNGKTEGQ